jgi:hypothetical protein
MPSARSACQDAATCSQSASGEGLVTGTTCRRSGPATLHSACWGSTSVSTAIVPPLNGGCARLATFSAATAFTPTARTARPARRHAESRSSSSDRRMAAATTRDAEPGGDAAGGRALGVARRERPTPLESQW